MMPVMARNLLESIRLLSPASPAARRPVRRRASPPTSSGCASYAESSPSVVTPLNRYIGYENAAKVAKQALAEEKTIREVVLEQGYVERGDLTEEQLDEALDVRAHDPPLTPVLNRRSRSRRAAGAPARRCTSAGSTLQPRPRWREWHATRRGGGTTFTILWLRGVDPGDSGVTGSGHDRTHGMKQGNARSAGRTGSRRGIGPLTSRWGCGVG